MDGREGTIDTFAAMKEIALEAAASRPRPHRPGAGSGSLDPRGMTRGAAGRNRAEVPRSPTAAIGERLLNADTLGGFRATGAPRTTQHEDRYLDTADGALARAGLRGATADVGRRRSSP